MKRRLAQRFYTRFHMSLILSSSGLAAMLASWTLLHAGLTSMLARYPFALGAAYLTFLLGVWVWLRYVGITSGGSPGRELLDNADVPDIRLGGGGGSSSSGGGAPRGGGGTFDGGGASASWAEAKAGGASSNLQTGAFMAASPDASAGDPGADLPSLAKSGSGRAGKGSSSKSGFGLDLGDLDGEAIVLLVLALALVAAIAFSSGYLVWFAPDILSEAAFGALLAGGLARRSKQEDAAGWISGVVRRTWWPFALVLLVAMAFAWYAGRHYPQAHTFRETIAAALGR